MIGKFVKCSKAALGFLNQRAFTLLVFLAGIGVAAYWFPNALTEGVTKNEIVSIILLISLPYLILKAVVLLDLLILDISINFSAKNRFIYKVNYEKAKARIAKLFIDKNIPFSKVDNFEFGIERYFVSVLQKYTTGTKFNYPANFISNRPFIVARIYDLKDGRTQVKVLFEEEKEAEVIARLIIASLQALEDEENKSASLQTVSFSAGAIRPIEKTEPNKVELKLVGKQEPKRKSGGLMEELKLRKKKK
ncbi:MAG: hypothetical protein ABIG96_00935 [Candidatus Micrarchaeota archaeon]